MSTKVIGKKNHNYRTTEQWFNFDPRDVVHKDNTDVLGYNR